MFTNIFDFHFFLYIVCKHTRSNQSYHVQNIYIYKTSLIIFSIFSTSHTLTLLYFYKKCLDRIIVQSSFSWLKVAAPTATLVAKSISPDSFFNLSLINSAIALCVRLSNFSNFLATSRFKSQSGFLGAKFEIS